ncbi:hypothetical protein FR483_n775R [Paramecium bursaria Chlorella virus FR483]|uniref:Uncharacterized protein n775R n=1 Tax=Paramecium bursaria Chlorella virus FR483 TaxID=399781 RepID=A7J8C9_PBCVF|nr:hypothetical protein FR483_n775R [Paramecium bursaria Chlorella virus FR483]ABT16060.1 hypothetical protein FR483_n775R [Paramecium bursaria Chlorella virus FR483]
MVLFFVMAYTRPLSFFMVSRTTFLMPMGRAAGFCNLVSGTRRGTAVLARASNIMGIGLLSLLAWKARPREASCCSCN